MKIGIIREGKIPPDKRVPFTPEQCKIILDQYPNVNLVVQRSDVRAFKDSEYENLGITLVDSLDDVDVVFGVKEVNIEDLIPGKVMFFFSHTIKEQPYNRKLLEAVVNNNIQLVDYECLTNKNNARLLGFGRYAGIVGCYNGFLAYGKASGNFQLKPAHLCADRKELEQELAKVQLPSNYRIVLTGLGRVAGGAIEILKKKGIKQVDPSQYLTESFDEPVFTQLSVQEYFRKKDGSDFERREAYNNPSEFDSDFMRFAEVSDMYIPCHFWDAEAPFIFTKEELMSNTFKIKTIADISCDIAGPVPSTIRPSTIENPIYYVDKSTLNEVDSPSDNTVTVMAVDNLPCELPKDASEDFGKELIDKIFPSLIHEDSETIIERASITKSGDLTDGYEYLRSYLEGN